MKNARVKHWWNWHLSQRDRRQYRQKDAKPPACRGCKRIGPFHQQWNPELVWNWGSISSTFYVQLLRSQIPKALKDTDDLTVFYTLLGSTSVKDVCKTLVRGLNIVLTELFHAVKLGYNEPCFNEQIFQFQLISKINLGIMRPD